MYQFGVRFCCSVGVAFIVGVGILINLVNNQYEHELIPIKWNKQKPTLVEDEWRKVWEIKKKLIEFRLR